MSLVGKGALSDSRLDCLCLKRNLFRLLFVHIRARAIYRESIPFLKTFFENGNPRFQFADCILDWLTVFQIDRQCVVMRNLSQSVGRSGWTTM